MLLMYQQGQERTKLQLTLSLQALKQAGAAGAFSWQVRGTWCFQEHLEHCLFLSSIPT